MAAQVAVIVPTFDRPLELRQTVRSVLSQVDVEVEVVIVDDGESRGDLGLVLEDARVRAVITPRPASGPATARNAGLESVTTPWVAFCDDDDLWHPAKLATQLGVAHGAGWITCGEAKFWVTRSGRPKVHRVSEPVSAEQILAGLHRQKSIPGGSSGIVVQTDLIQTVGGYRDLPIVEDWDLWFRLADRSPVAIAPERLVGVRLHARAVTADVRQLRRGTDGLAALLTGPDGSPPVLRDTAGDLRWYAEIAARSGQRRLAMSLQAEAARSSGRVRDRLVTVAIVAAPRGVWRFRAFKRRLAIPAEERRPIEHWLRSALDLGAT